MEMTACDNGSLYHCTVYVILAILADVTRRELDRIDSATGIK